VVGIDVNAENVRQLNELGFKEVMLQSAEEFALPERFDTIVAGEVIEHLSNPGKFLERARAHLKPGGLLLLTTPNPFSLLNIAYALWKYPKTCSNPEHTCWFGRSTIAELARRYGFETVRFELIEDYAPDCPRWPYRTFVKLLRLVSPLLPKRLKGNCMLLVLRLASPGGARGRQ